jgi:hypothetical protein
MIDLDDTDMPDNSVQDAAIKAETLIESLSWLKRFSGQTIVIKFGGNAMVDDALKRSFAEDIVYLRYAGIRPVVVHGGGPQISAELARRGITSEFRGGYRVTTPEAIDAVRDVLTVQVNGELVGMLNEHGPLAVGLSGETANLFGGRRRGAIVDGVTVDLGLVGDVVGVRRTGSPFRRTDPGHIHHRTRPRLSRPVAERQRGCGRRISRGCTRGGKARCAHRRCRFVPQLAEPRFPCLSHPR